MRGDHISAALFFLIKRIRYFKLFHKSPLDKYYAAV
jgi:hypothetical protein